MVDLLVEKMALMQAAMKVETMAGRMVGLMADLWVRKKVVMWADLKVEK
jgi:hypothetical protein